MAQMPLSYLPRIAQVAAPTFFESERAQLMVSLWQELGFEPLMDQTGNVLVKLGGGDLRESPALLLASHLDTVFDRDTDVNVREDGQK